MYVRLDKDEDLLRIHCQFAPESEVSRVRTVKSLMWAFPRMETVARQNNLKGFVYKSTSKMLIEFMERKFGFRPTGNDDHTLLLQEG